MRNERRQIDDATCGRRAIRPHVERRRFARRIAIGAENEERRVVSGEGSRAAVDSALKLYVIDHRSERFDIFQRFSGERSSCREIAIEARRTRIICREEAGRSVSIEQLSNIR
nr:hypothetical protein [Methylosinus sporium]